jgi:hypothetical protein
MWLKRPLQPSMILAGLEWFGGQGICVTHFDVHFVLLWPATAYCFLRCRISVSELDCICETPALTPECWCLCQQTAVHGCYNASRDNILLPRLALHATCRSLADRQAGTMATHPTEEQIITMHANWWQQGNLDGLRMSAMFKEQTSTAGRGSDIREVEFADRFMYVYDQVAPVRAVAMITIKQNGKTNQVSGAEAFMRFCCCIIWCNGC